MAVLGLRTSIIYGPVRSRRLGRSLGINLLPARQKLCSFDCVYCHYGRTTVKTLRPDLDSLPRTEEVLRAVEEALRVHPDIQALTFSGHGEPTLHPHFPEIVSGVRQLRDELGPDVKLTILSNSTGLLLPRVRESLGLFDASIMKLDAGDPGTLASINCPVPGVSLDEILEALREMPGLVVQSVLVDGRVSNVRDDAFESWLAALARVEPARVQIYSTDRPVPEAGVEKVPPLTLQRIAGEVERRTGFPVSASWAEA